MEATGWSNTWPTDVESWLEKAEDAFILPHTTLNDLKNPAKRHKSERHMKTNGDRRRTPIPLSGSTAKLDDFMYLRAIVKNDVSNSDALELLIRSGYTDKESWEKALRLLGLRTDETSRDFKVVAYEVGEIDASRPTQDFRFTTGNSTLSAGGIFTPTRLVDEAKIPQVPLAPKKERAKEPQFAEGTQGFHNPLANTDKWEPEKVQNTLFLGTRPDRSKSATRRGELDWGSLMDDELFGDWQHNTPTPGARHVGRGRIAADNEDEDEDEVEDEDDEYSIYLPALDNSPPEQAACDETYITLFYCNFFTSMMATMYLLPLRKSYTFLPDRKNFCFGRGSEYAVNASVDGRISRPISDRSKVDDKSMLAMAEFKAGENQPFIYQMAFEFAGWISERYAAGGADANFDGRRYLLATSQRGTILGIILAEYTQSWVKYVQNGNNTVIPRDGVLDEEDMLVLHQLHSTDLGSKTGVNAHAAFLGSVVEKDFDTVQLGQ